MYITTSLHTYSPKNKLQAEMVEYIKQYKHIIITDELSLDALKCEIESTVNELNAKHPRVKPLFFRTDKLDRGIFSYRVTYDGSGYPQEVFILNFAKVRSVYKFSEQTKIE